MPIVQRAWFSLASRTPLLNRNIWFSDNGRSALSPTSKRWGAIASLSCVLVLSACSAPSSSNSTEINSAPTVAVSSDPSASPGVESPSSSPSTTPQPLRADDIRSFLEQGSIEDSSQCPSKSIAEAEASSLKKLAYFETTHYWIEICTHENGDLEYYGRKRDQPNLDLAIAAYRTSDQSKEFVAQNGNTVYQINASELVVTQNGVPIIREPVVRSSFNQ